MWRGLRLYFLMDNGNILYIEEGWNIRNKKPKPKALKHFHLANFLVTWDDDLIFAFWCLFTG